MGSLSHAQIGVLLGVQFKFLNEHPRLFHMGIPTGITPTYTKNVVDHVRSTKSLLAMGTIRTQPEFQNITYPVPLLHDVVCKLSKESVKH